jgi:hypothetical protein
LFDALQQNAATLARHAMMRPANSADAAMWIPRALHSFAKDVGSLIPEGFESYARILHPYFRQNESGNVVPVRWREIAAANNRSVQDEVLNVGISGEPASEGLNGEALWDQQIPSGTLSIELADRLVGHLRPHTQSPTHCYFAIWEGWAGMHSWVCQAPSFSIPHRVLHLVEGPIDDALNTFDSESWIFRSANMWWPNDRTWIVSTEIDCTWTYVGGSQSCIAQILIDPFVEATRVDLFDIR